MLLKNQQTHLGVCACRLEELLEVKEALQKQLEGACLSLIV
jgi:hypothetical protein